jgi:ssDNA-binding Zn-finger/Zn-ribbon topoisomerase 1
MLMAYFENCYVLARDSEKGLDYRCPNCKGELTLKKGRKVVHHFAHKPPVRCSYAAGETEAHLKSKLAFYDYFKSQGFNVSVEYQVSFNGLNSRADVFVHDTRRAIPAAIEIQHTNISLDEIERRTQNYHKLGVAVGWVPLIDFDKHIIYYESPKRFVIEKYSPKPFERWIHGFNFGEVWYYEYKKETLWKGVFSPHMIEVPYSEWYEQGGNQVSVGGYTKYSKRWKKLTLTGMYGFREVMFSTVKREAKSIGNYNYPVCHMVKITPK